MSLPIEFTVKAASKVYELIKEDGDLDLKLCAYITGGGCSGMQYHFTFKKECEEGDTIISRTILDQGEERIVQLLIDPWSLTYLAGAKIDYKEDIEGEQFIIHNPNAKTTCGCGSSFNTEE